MAKEILAIPEENLKDVIGVIRNGLKVTNVSNDTKTNLNEWCEDMVEYLRVLNENQ